MMDDRTIRLVEIPTGGKGGFVWNRLHGEREEICEALLNQSAPVSEERKELLQARLRKVDDALDRVMAGSYGNCAKCGRPIDKARLDIDPALGVCLNCRGKESGSVYLSADKNEINELDSSSEVMVNTLRRYDTVLLRTVNSEYRILMLEPTAGRALVEGGSYLVEPTEALLRGSAVPGSAFKGGAIRVGWRLELWVDDRVFITSPVESIEVTHNGAAEPVENISAALN